MAINPTETKKHWTDEERLQLAEKLDKDLDDFISGLEKKPYTEGWPEDRWQEVSCFRTENELQSEFYACRKWKNIRFS